MRNLHVFDIDGTIIKGHNLAYALSKYVGEEFPYKELTQYNIGENLLKKGYIQSLDEFDNGEFFRRYEEEIFVNVELIDGIKTHLNKLEGMGKEIYFLTARPWNLHTVTKNFFEEFGLQKYIPKLFMNVDGKSAKLNFVNKMFPNTDVTMYEDKDSTIVDFYEHGHNIVRVNQPYNAHLNFDGDHFISIDDYHSPNFKKWGI